MNDNITLDTIIGALSGSISIILVALSIIPQTIKTYKTKDYNFGSLLTFSTYLFSALCYFIASLLLLLFMLPQTTQPFSVWEWLFYLSPIILNTIGAVCSTLIVIFISRIMIVRKKSWIECKNDISNWVISTNDVKKASGFAKAVMFFRTKLGFILVGGFLFAGLITLLCLCIKMNWNTDYLTKEQIAALLIANSIGAITWTIINWPLFFSSWKYEKIEKISILYIIFNTISALILLIYGIIVMCITGWYPTTIFGCIFNGSGCSLLILYRKIKLIFPKNKIKTNV